MNERVEAYVRDTALWKRELKGARKILIDCGLTEDFRWRGPCYTHEGKNIVTLGTLKAGCSLGFLKGALLKDPRGVLEKPGANSRIARRIVVTSVSQIRELEPAIRDFVSQAIEAERAGQKVELPEDSELDLPDEVERIFETDPKLRAAFEALTPGRRRGYLLHFRSAIQSATRTARVKNCTTKIMAGKGMHDCVCGRSARMPRCDGSHKDA